MDQWLSGLLSAFARDLVCGAVEQLRLPCCFNGFVDDLQGVQDKLIGTKNSVNDSVEHGRKQAMKSAQVIHEWLEREAKPLKGNVEDLLEKARINKSCCFGHCPNWILRYRLAKKIAKKKVEVEKCIEEGSKYIQLERVASLPSMEYLKFDSRQSTYDQLMEALKDDEVTMIALYGMGGCGKTTIAEELMRTAEAEHLFDKVLFVPVSNNIEVRKIQDNIASALQYQFHEDGKRERAQRLHTKLAHQEKKTLMILDDVWEFLDFGEIGIPSGENNKNCKVMITTRSESVCTSMDCQRMISLSTLTDEEAWQLFQKQAHISESTPNNLKHLGRLISNECKGLPVAIAALASTLKGKVEVNWKVALDRLRSSIVMNIEKGLPNPYTCLEVSYDNLDLEEAKALLLCSVCPEDYEIPVEDLTIFAIRLGLVRQVGSFEGARNKVSVAKNKLVSSSLLSSSFDYDEEECVKMHDLIRDAAHRIASKENKAIKCDLKKDMTSECSSIRYLWCKELPNDQLDCSCIEFLSLKTKLEISDELFKGMKRLRVLILNYVGGKKIGSFSTASFKLLTNLHCLSLSLWELGDISSIGYMKKLESLMLFDCSFFELPDVVITEVTNLRLLHLSKCCMKKNPFKVIAKLPQLEELYYEDMQTSERSEIDSEGGGHDQFFKMSSVPQALQTSSMLEEFKGKLFGLQEDLQINGLHTWEILSVVKSHHGFVPEETRVENPNEEGTFTLGLGDEYASSSEVQSTLSGVMGSGDTQSTSEPSLLNQQKRPGETTTTTEIPQSIKRDEGASSHNAETNIEGTETTTNGEIPTLPKPTLPTFGSELATPLHVIPSSSIEDKIQESVQEGYTSKDNMEAAISAGIEGNGLGVVVVPTKTSQSQKMPNDDDSIQEESNSMDKGEIDAGFKGSIAVHPEACADTSGNHLSIVAELEAFKHYVDMDDAQIALLAEAIAVYPHLWKVLPKFSVRFQAWKAKTLADMLVFLRNESAASVTPQREKEFQKLCVEAVQLGFDKPWVDEMRERVMVRYPGVEHAKTRLNELLKRCDQPTQELHEIKDEIDNLHNFVGSQKKCFDFL